MSLDQIDGAIIEKTQGGLPIVAEPYADVAETLGLTEEDLLVRLRSMQRRGVIRRVAVAPNHYRLGMTANGMTVWEVEDALAAGLGAQVGELEFVSHCYLRPRALPVWPYNLFARVPGSTRAEVERKRAFIADLLGDACSASDTLFSRRILKKTGLRLGGRI